MVKISIETFKEDGIINKPNGAFLNNIGKDYPSKTIFKFFF